VVWHTKEVFEKYSTFYTFLFFTAISWLLSQSSIFLTSVPLWWFVTHSQNFKKWKFLSWDIGNRHKKSSVYLKYYSVQCTHMKYKNKCTVFSYRLTEIIQFLHTCHIQSNNSSYCQWIGSFKNHLGMSLLSFTLFMI
jgi:hypothetical protein